MKRAGQGTQGEGLYYIIYSLELTTVDIPSGPSPSDTEAVSPPTAEPNVEASPYLVGSTSITSFRSVNASPRDRNGSTTYRPLKRLRIDQEAYEICYDNLGKISAAQAGLPLDVLANIALPDGSRLPIANLEEQLPNGPGFATGMEGIGTDIDAQGEPSGIALRTIVSPECRLHILSDVAGEAERLDQEIGRDSAQEEEINLFIYEFLNLDPEDLE
jgi:hypothetical protein